MFEPIVLKKKQFRTFAGTPAGTVFIITSLTKILVPFVGLSLLTIFKKIKYNVYYFLKNE